eukprot:2390656-Rhodomonas_salina.1
MAPAPRSTSSPLTPARRTSSQVVSAYAPATRCPVLTERMLLPAHYPSHAAPLFPSPVPPATSLRPPYAKSGTDIAYAAARRRSTPTRSLRLGSYARATACP